MSDRVTETIASLRAHLADHPCSPPVREAIKMYTAALTERRSNPAHLLACVTDRDQTIARIGAERDALLLEVEELRSKLAELAGAAKAAAL